MTLISSEETIKFEEKVAKQDNGCWLWTGARYESGYGKFTVRKEHERIQVPAHRLAWKIYRDKELASITRLQNTCGYRSCVNPDHWPIKQNHEAVTTSEIDCDGDDPRLDGAPPEVETLDDTTTPDEPRTRFNPFDLLANHK